MRGESSMLAVVILIAVSIALSIIVGSWVTNLSNTQSNTIRNQTKSQLECQFADLFIKNMTYRCINNCSAGNRHNFTMVVTNSGKIRVTVDLVTIQNTTGNTMVYSMNSTTVDVGTSVTLFNTSTDSCNGINRTVEKVIISSVTCPSTASDSLDGDEINWVGCG